MPTPPPITATVRTLEAAAKAFEAQISQQPAPLCRQDHEDLAAAAVTLDSTIERLVTARRKLGQLSRPRPHPNSPRR